MSLRNELLAFVPGCQQEEMDRKRLLAALAQPGILTRENAAQHFTASAWVVNGDGRRVVMLYHNLYHSWAWAGGHADGEENLLSVALREVEEETGLVARPLSEKPCSLEVLTVGGHRKKGRYVEPHLHLNLTYLLLAEETAPLRIKADENSGVRWFDRDAAVEASTEPYLQEIYRKLNSRSAAYFPSL